MLFSKSLLIQLGWEEFFLPSLLDPNGTWHVTLGVLFEICIAGAVAKRWMKKSMLHLSFALPFPWHYTTNINYLGQNFSALSNLKAMQSLWKRSWTLLPQKCFCVERQFSVEHCCSWCKLCTRNFSGEAVLSCPELQWRFHQTTFLLLSHRNASVLTPQIDYFFMGTFTVVTQL